MHAANNDEQFGKLSQTSGLYKVVRVLAGSLLLLLCAVLACWTAYLLNCLYCEHRQRQEKEMEGVVPGRVMQYHEVMGALLGPWGAR